MGAAEVSLAYVVHRHGAQASSRHTVLSRKERSGGAAFSRGWIFFRRQNSYSLCTPRIGYTSLVYILPTIYLPSLFLPLFFFSPLPSSRLFLLSPADAGAKILKLKRISCVSKSKTCHSSPYRVMLINMSYLSRKATTYKDCSRLAPAITL